MNISDKHKRDPLFLHALEDAIYVTSPSINLSGGFSGKNSIALSKKNLPKEITSAKILLVDKSTILLACNLKIHHTPFQVRLYVQFSNDVVERITVNKDAQNLGYAYLYAREVEKDEPIVNILIGSLKESQKAGAFALADMISFEHTKLITIPTKIKK